MKRRTTLAMVFSLLGLIVVASVSADATVPCPTLALDTRFVDPRGNAVDPATVDAIAFKETDGGTVLVYRRTPADAEALVRGLVVDGESDPALLNADTWLVAQAASCQMRVGNKCSGACKGPGKQTCKRIKKPGKDICTCSIR